jgi:hypothetical protein
MALILDGTLGLTVPAASIGNLTLSNSSISGLTATGISAVQQLPTGSVLQVVQSTTTSSLSTTATGTYTTTGFSASITPKFSTSKIMVLVNGNVDTNSSAIQGNFNVYRNANPLSTYGFAEAYSSTGRLQTALAINYLDSPSTTSSTTYTLYFTISSGSGTLTFNGSSNLGSQVATFTLMEIAG